MSEQKSETVFNNETAGCLKKVPAQQPAQIPDYSLEEILPADDGEDAIASFASFLTAVNNPTSRYIAARSQLKITTPRHWRLPRLRLATRTRSKSQAFVNTPLLRSEAVDA